MLEPQTQMTSLESFESCALPYAKELFRAAVCALSSHAEAEDAVQETFLQAWKSFDQFSPGTNCRAWLYKILFHVVSHHRRKWFRFGVAEDVQILEDRLVEKPVVLQHLTDQDVLSAFQRVPQKYAEVVMLADVEEFTYKEIQETLGIPIGTVMSRLSRGREALRSHLAKSSCERVQTGATARGAQA